MYAQSPVLPHTARGVLSNNSMSRYTHVVAILPFPSVVQRIMDDERVAAHCNNSAHAF